jgi:two-component system sensor histidine kinase YesM
MIALITSIILFVVTSIGLFSYVESSRTIRNDLERFGSQILEQANLNLSRYFREYEQFFLFLGGSREYEEWLAADTQKYEVVKKFNDIVEFYVQPFALQHPELMSLTLYKEDGYEVHYRSHTYLRGDYSIEDQPWLLDGTDSGRMFTFAHLSADYGAGDATEGSTVPVISVIRQVSNLRHEGYLKADFSLEPTLHILSSIDLGENSTGLLVDPENRIVAHRDPTRIMTPLPREYAIHISESGNGSFFSARTEEMVVYTRVPNTDWKSIVIVPYGNVARSIFRIRDVTALIALLSLIVAVYLAILVSSSITGRIHELHETIRNTELASFDTRVPVTGTDEVAGLGLAYNRMLDRLRDSMAQLSETRRLQQEAVMVALQSQIDSHFLYNTLESINSMAHLADHREIEQTTIALSHMMRYTANYEDSVVTVLDEITHLENYLKIITMRYGADITYSVRVQEDCDRTPCLKAILQPIAENCIKHGFDLNAVFVRGTPFHIDVDVDALPDGDIRIEITDNGTGFDLEKLAHLKADITGDDLHLKYREISRIGLLNVHYRLRLFYKDERAGIDVENTDGADAGGGARVVVRFPAEVDPRLLPYVNDSVDGG